MVRSSNFRPCKTCVQRKTVCLVLRSGRSSACTGCQAVKRQCNIKETVKWLIASGKLGGPEDVSVEPRTVQDVQSLESGRSADVVLSQVVSLRQDVTDLRLKMDDRLRSIELRLGELVSRPPGTREDQHMYGGNEGKVRQAGVGRQEAVSKHGSSVEDEDLGGGRVGGLESDYEQPESDSDEYADEVGTPVDMGE